MQNPVLITNDLEHIQRVVEHYIEYNRNRHFKKVAVYLEKLEIGDVNELINKIYEILTNSVSQRPCKVSVFTAYLLREQAPPYYYRIIYASSNSSLENELRTIRNQQSINDFRDFLRGYNFHEAIMAPRSDYSFVRFLYVQVNVYTFRS